MPFNTALSGIRAASSDLKITGNNIANASTTGFKASRAEFGDVYAKSVLGSGTNIAGSGVRLQDIAQQFNQGNISFTENPLDLAISGSGFFVVEQNGDQLYTRAGAFGMDDDGFIVSNTGARLQGFAADENGNVSGVIGDIQIQTGNEPPRQTTQVESRLNLDATEPVLASIGTTFVTDGAAIAVPQIGLLSATTTTLTGAGFTLPIDIATNPISFDVSLAGSATGNNGTVSINLSTLQGVPANIGSFNDLRTLVGVINGQIFAPTAPQTAIDVIASAVDDGGGNFHIEFADLTSGQASTITVEAAPAPVNAGQIGLAGGDVSVAGQPAVDNGYPAQSVDITDADGDVITYNSQAGASAAQVASELSAIPGVSATATTTATLTLAGFVNGANNLIINLNGVQLTGDTLPDIGAQINALSTTTLPGITGTIDTATGDLVITSSVGDDLKFSISSPDAGDSIVVEGTTVAPAQTLTLPGDSGNGIVVGGELEIILNEDVTVSNPNPPAIGLFGAFTSTTFQPFNINEFDPNDQSTYNHATSVTVYDSLGNSHVMTQYFVKESFDPTDPTQPANAWTMYVLIDGEDVGDPDTTLLPPANTEPTRASFGVVFNEDGSLNPLLSDNMLISNWTPLDEDGNQNGALGPLNVLQGATSPPPEPPTSSNILISLDGSTQFGSDFSVNEVDQNGFSTGRLSGVDIDESGILFARFTNGRAQVLAQLALASFNNQQGLQPVGDTMWAENFESGEPTIGPANSGALGAIQSGALEESNVDLSEQLVNLIIAQRNFQASAKTIETANQITQAVINLR